MGKSIDGYSDPELRKEHQRASILSNIEKGEVPYKTYHSMEDCMRSYFEYIARIANHDMRVFYYFYDKHGNKQEGVFNYQAPKRVTVSDNLFRSYSCVDLGCSKCCWNHGYVNIFTENEFETFEALYGSALNGGAGKGYDPFSVKINGKDTLMFSYSHIKNYCKHLDQDLGANNCGVHEWNPLHCAFPLMKFKKVKDTTFVTREQFGRNWQIKCPAEFKPMTGSGFDYTMALLYRVRLIAEELDVETKIENIIKQVQSRQNQLKLL